ncbi:S-layer homology domain-containing protein [Paenibacillus sp. N3.4]|uniref:S-layer homology domain-containing protein n=1 Tax=Paenibacillus sp. N3.4 TaxID=2603222 RepID=UPI0011CA5EFC|nr:S-layer homology domain-containing protein [Paenibacillus sp. N3.4]TXK79855.1 S-layer homology domain-containing protein [Paenibacillus sp. N3.4]
MSLDGKILITVPANASDKELKITIEELSEIPGLLANHEVLASSIFEILKNYSGNFSKPVTLTFTFDPTKVKDNQTIALFYYDEGKKAWVEVPGGKIDGNQIRVEVNHFTKFAVLVVDKKSGLPIVATESTEVNFSDIAGHWAEETIKQAVRQGIVNGYTDGSFKPDATITRAEIVTMLMNAWKPSNGNTTLSFTDTNEITTWAKKAITQAVESGILSGYTDGSFRPDGNIARMEMAMMIAKAYGAKIPTDVATGFSDESEIPEWAKGAVFMIKQIGIVKGRDGNQFAPKETVTRAEAVTVIMNLLHVKKIE